MGFGTKGWRRIVVEGRTFYWQAHGSWLARASDWWGLFRVPPEREPHRLLSVIDGRCGGAGGFGGRVTPGVVRGCIESAVASGWLAERPALRQALFGGPPRCASIDRSWLSSTVVALVRQMCAARDFGAMPILADALQDAGCGDEDVLSHCRDANTAHARGCWAVDLLLGER